MIKHTQVACSFCNRFVAPVCVETACHNIIALVTACGRDHRRHAVQKIFAVVNQHFAHIARRADRDIAMHKASFDIINQHATCKTIGLCGRFHRGKRDVVVKDHLFDQRVIGGALPHRCCQSCAQRLFFSVQRSCVARKESHFIASNIVLEHSVLDDQSAG